MRDDAERAGAIVTDFDLCTDWHELFTRDDKRRIRRACRLLRALYLMHFSFKQLNRELDLWVEYAGKLIDDAVHLFSGFEVITTDRLHAHLLACLMEIPNTIWNNSYGKNHTYVTAWTGSSNLVQLGHKDLPSGEGAR